MYHFAPDQVALAGAMPHLVEPDVPVAPERRRGRGTLSNTSGRYERESREAVDARIQT